MPTATPEAPARKRPQAPAAAKPPQQKTDAAWLKELDALKGDALQAKNEKYPTMTNAQVRDVLRWQIAKKKIKAGEAIKPADGKLLRIAAAAYPKVMDNLTAEEKEALVNFTKAELNAEQQKRADEKPGLKGKARFLWVMEGKATASQAADGRAAAKASGSGERAQRAPRTPKSYREGTFEPLVTDVHGALAFLCDGDPAKGDPMIFVGQFGEDEFYGKVEAAVKKHKLDADTVQIVTLRSRYARVSRASATTAAAA